MGNEAGKQKLQGPRAHRTSSVLKRKTSLVFRAHIAGEINENFQVGMRFKGLYTILLLSSSESSRLTLTCFGKRFSSVCAVQIRVCSRVWRPEVHLGCLSQFPSTLLF